MAAASGTTNGATTRMTSSGLGPVVATSTPSCPMGPSARPAMTVPRPPRTQLSPPTVPTSLSRGGQSRDSQTSTAPRTQPRNGITSRTMVVISSHGVAGLAGWAWTPERSRASAAMSAGSPRRSSKGEDAGLGLGVEVGPGGGDVLLHLVQELLATVGGQVAELGFEMLEIAQNQGVGFGGHGPSPCRSRRSAAPV